MEITCFYLYERCRLLQKRFFRLCPVILMMGADLQFLLLHLQRYRYFCLNLQRVLQKWVLTLVLVLHLGPGHRACFLSRPLTPRSDSSINETGRVFEYMEIASVAVDDEEKQSVVFYADDNIEDGSLSYSVGAKPLAYIWKYRASGRADVVALPTID